MDSNTSINHVELKGRVGQDPKIFNAGESRVARFSVATSETFHDRKGDIREETTWHSICVWDNRNINDFKEIRKGVLVTLEGRLRNVRYTSADGSERYVTEVVANKLNIVKN